MRTCVGLNRKNVFQEGGRKTLCCMCLLYRRLEELCFGGSVAFLKPFISISCRAIVDHRETLQKLRMFCGSGFGFSIDDQVTPMLCL